MTDHAWKKFERRVGRALGGERRGADYGSANGGKNDIVGVEGFSIECKLLGAPRWADVLNAVEQARSAGDPNDIPIAVLKRKNHADAKAVVCITLSDFAAWFGGGNE